MNKNNNPNMKKNYEELKELQLNLLNRLIGEKDEKKKQILINKITENVNKMLQIINEDQR